MRSHRLALTTFVALMGLAYPAASADHQQELQTLLARMDKAAPAFKAMTAQVTHVTHTDVLNEDSTESGTVIMQKLPSGEVAARVDFTQPDPHVLIVEKRQAQRFFPKIKTLEVYDLGDKGELLDKFMMIGFGTSGAELAKDYDVTVLATEPLKDQPGRFVHVRLMPKSQEARQYVKSTDLWIPESGDPYPISEKILEPSADYLTVIYSNVKINPPLKPDAVQLKPPGGVNIVHPGK